MAWNVLAFLISVEPGSSSHNDPRLQIRFGGRRIELETDEHFLQQFSDIFLDLTQESTLHALIERWPFQWADREQFYYDTINPFGDKRQIQYKTMWTFDVPNDRLLRTTKDGWSEVSLALFRHRRVTLVDFKYIGPAGPRPLLVDVDSNKSYWQPEIVLDDRLRAFAHRILRDFNKQWRHVLRSDYNFTTLRILASGLIRLATLGFNVVEFTTPRQVPGGSSWNYTWITDLPPWNTLGPNNSFRVGDLKVILCRSVQDGLSELRQMVKQDQECPSRHTPSVSTSSRPQYMLFSVRQIMLCRFDGKQLKYTAPMTLCTGIINGRYSIETPSDLVLDYLVWALQAAVPIVSTQLQTLPIEIQDKILYANSPSPVAAAKLGCLLRLGSPLLWKDGPLILNLQEFRKRRMDYSPVESQILFGDFESGLMYKGESEAHDPVVLSCDS